MPRYDGIVSLDQDDVEVFIDLDPDRVHLRAGDVEVGNWAAGECAIAALGDGVYSITAENQSLRFVPHDPRRFENGLNHGTGYGLSPSASAPEDQRAGRHARQPPPAPGSLRETEAPPPKPLTVVLFYGLAAMTAAFGTWALISIL